MTIQQLIEQTQQQLNLLFSASNGKVIKILSVMNDRFTDLPFNEKIGDLLYQQAPILLIIDYIDLIDQQKAKLISIKPQQTTLITTAVNKNLSQEEQNEILNAKQPPDLDLSITIHQNEEQTIQQQQQPVQKHTHTSNHHINQPQCQPYCIPLAEFGVNNQICPICGNVKAYCPSKTEKCTSLCKTGEVQKLKAHGLQFCSICLSRYRQGKYSYGCIHQCSRCHRPWLQLSSDFLCRTCFQIVNKGKGTVFRPVETRVIPEDNIQINIQTQDEEQQDEQQQQQQQEEQKLQ